MRFFPTFVVGGVLLAASLLPAQGYSLVVTETPSGGGNLQPVQRYRLPHSNGPLTRLSDLPVKFVGDPAGVAFRNPAHLFVGDRSMGSGVGAVSTFRLDPTFQVFVPGQKLIGNGLSRVHQIAFDPVEGELYAANLDTGTVSRFHFDAAGNAVSNGMLQMPNSGYALGVAVRAIDQQLFVSENSLVRRFAKAGEGFSYLGDFAPPGAAQIHYLKFRGDELYVCEFGANAIYRYTFDAAGTPVPNGTVSSPNPLDVAFSPDLTEMFVSSHLTGGIRRYLHDPITDGWLLQSTTPGPSYGGIATNADYFLVHGTACQASAVPVTLSGHGIASPGRTIDLLIGHGQPLNFAAIGFGLSTGTVPVGSCTWLLTAMAPDTCVLQLDAAGAAMLPIPLPPNLRPWQLHAQAFLLDTTVSQGFTTSNGLRVAIF